MRLLRFNILLKYMASLYESRVRCRLNTLYLFKCHLTSSRDRAVPTPVLRFHRSLTYTLTRSHLIRAHTLWCLALFYFLIWCCLLFSGTTCKNTAISPLRNQSRIDAGSNLTSAKLWSRYFNLAKSVITTWVDVKELKEHSPGWRGWGRRRIRVGENEE